MSDSESPCQEQPPTVPPPKSFRPFDAYFESIRDIALRTSSQMLALVEHSGERGSLSEEVVKNLLRTLLPSKYALGSGFVFNAKGNISRQTDIVIYDHANIQPVNPAMGVSMYPVEGVVATVEVKTTLNITELKRSLENTKLMREISNGSTKASSLTSAPKNYLVAFNLTGISDNTPEFATKLEFHSDAILGILDGLLILAPDWFFSQTMPHFSATEISSNSVRAFAEKLIRDQRQFVASDLNLATYLNPPNELDID